MNSKENKNRGLNLFLILVGIDIFAIIAVSIFRYKYGNSSFASDDLGEAISQLFSEFPIAVFIIIAVSVLMFFILKNKK